MRKDRRNRLSHRAALPQPRGGVDASEQADQGVGRGPGGPPHQIVARWDELCGMSYVA